MSDKLGVIDALLDRVDALLVGGAMAFTLLAADGGEVGGSLVEPDRFGAVLATRERARAKGIPIELPVDVVAATDVASADPPLTVLAGSIPGST